MDAFAHVSSSFANEVAMLWVGLPMALLVIGRGLTRLFRAPVAGQALTEPRRLPAVEHVVYHITSL